MKPNPMIPLFVAASLQVMPMVRAVLPTAQAVAPSAWIVVFKLAVGAAALLGSHDTVSGATTIVAPHTVNATNGVRYIRQLTTSGRIAGSWSANTAPVGSTAFPLSPGLYLTNATGKIGGTPTRTGTSTVTITVWEFANNTGGKLSVVFTITVHPATGPPGIATQPQSTQVVEGLDATFTVSARGSEPFAYQWRLNGANVIGRTNSTLTLTNVGPGDAGLYSVRISNLLGASNSLNATLTVLLQPVILSQPAPAVQAVTVNDPITLAVTARGSVPMGFQWRRNGIAITNMVLNTTNCVLTIPSAQLAHAGLYTVVVTNAANSNGIVSASAVVNVTAGSANTPPWLSPLPEQLLLVGETCTLQAQATDDNTPAQTLTYSLLPGAPPGAAIDPSSGLLTWPTVGLPVPQTNTIGIRVTDNGNPSLSATQSVRIVVTANHAPALAAIPDFTGEVLRLMRHTNVVADADALDRFTFSLGPNAPQGAHIRSTNGVFSWSPSRQQARSTNFITVIATDNGVPPRSDSRTFKVVVNDYVELYASQREDFVGGDVDMPLIVSSSTPVRNLTFNVEFHAHFTNFTVEPAIEGAAVSLTFVESNRVGLRLTRTSLQPANGETLAYLSFIIATNQPSAFVPMEFTQLVVERPGGALVDRRLTTPGRVVAVGIMPLMEGFPRATYALVHGLPDQSQIVERATTLLNGGNWSQIFLRTQSALSDAITLTEYLGTNRPSPVFFRARPTHAGQ